MMGVWHRLARYSYDAATDRACLFVRRPSDESTPLHWAPSSVVTAVQSIRAPSPSLATEDGLLLPATFTIAAMQTPVGVARGETQRWFTKATKSPAINLESKRRRREAQTENDSHDGRGASSHRPAPPAVPRPGVDRSTPSRPRRRRRRRACGGGRQRDGRIANQETSSSRGAGLQGCGWIHPAAAGSSRR